jgi:hypothetical protein
MTTHENSLALGVGRTLFFDIVCACMIGHVSWDGPLSVFYKRCASQYREDYITKESHIIKGSLKLDHPITSKVYNYTMWALLFCRIKIGVEFQDPRVQVWYDLFVSMVHVGWMKNMFDVCGKPCCCVL